MFTAIENVTSEFGQTLRRLLREWGFVVAFVLTLALGIGANGAVFTALNAYLLRPLPYPHAGQLSNAYFGMHALPFPKGIIQAAAYERLRKTPGVTASGLFEGNGTDATGGTATVISNGKPKSVSAVSVTSSLFKTLGVQPLLGRWLDPASNRPGGPSEVVVSYRFWQSAFGGEPDAIGQPLKIDGKQYTLVGVMPKSFNFPDRSTMLWRSLVLTPGMLNLSSGLVQFNWNMIVRRAPGVSPAALNTALDVQLKRVLSQLPPTHNFSINKPYVGLIPLRNWFGGATGGRLLLLQLGAALLLILAAANLGNLALVRTLRRRHELGLRLALGASRLALLRLALAETLPLGIAAAIVGWFLSRFGATALAHFGVASGQTAFTIGAGGSAALFGVLLSLAVAFIALSAPLVLVRSHHLTALLQSGGGRGAAGGRGSRGTRKGLSMVQIALAVALLSASALVGLSLHRMLNQNPGFKPNGLTVATVKLAGPAYKSYGQVAGAWRATQSAVAALPGVRAAGLGFGVPFTGGSPGGAFAVADNGNPTSHQNAYTISILVAGAHLLGSLDVHLLHGRLLNEADVQDDAHVVVLDAASAQAMFGTANVVGRRIQSHSTTWRIVGVIAALKTNFAFNASSNSPGLVIMPATKTVFGSWLGPTVNIVLRSSLPTRTVMGELDSTLAKVLPEQSITQAASMHSLIADSAQGTSALATLLIAFGLLAFVLASVGTYGVVTYLTRLRQREFAVRLVLGARPGQIEWLVLGQGIALWAAGAVFGVGLALLFGRFLRSQLYGVSLLSPAAYMVPALVLGLVVVLASWLPARRMRRTALAETLNPQ
ncbi:MAG: ABC transporter permease [Gammaproteobacteria bacterium]